MSDLPSAQFFVFNHVVNIDSFMQTFTAGTNLHRTFNIRKFHASKIDAHTNQFREMRV